MSNIVVTLMYTLVSRLVEKNVVKYIKEEAIAVSVEALEGWQKKLKVYENVKEKGKYSLENTKSYILSMVIDIVVAYLKEKDEIK